jgi:thioredoxin reductase (NADPH)
MDDYDIVVIGAGPAGLSSALYAARARRSTLVLERAGAGGQIAQTSLVENYPGAPEIDGFALGERMREQAAAAGAEFRFAEVQSIERTSDSFVVATDEGPVFARALIYAAGATYNELGVPGEERLMGRGVSYCATCDAAFFTGQEVAVVGGGDAALDEALFVARYAGRVHLLHRRDVFRAQRTLQERVAADPKIEVHWNTSVEAIEGANEVERLLLRDTSSGNRSELAVSGIFIFIGQTPNTTLLRGLVPLNTDGYVETDLEMRTHVPGIFAAGDVRARSARQAISAAGDGATAAITADRYLDSLLLAAAD